MIYTHVKNVCKAVLLLSLFVIGAKEVSAQGATCEMATQLCGGASFPAITGGGNTTTSSSSNCLGVTRNETWFYVFIDASGSISAPVSIAPGSDIDFGAWGPFADTNSCGSISTANEVSCDYTTTNGGTLTIAGATVGEYYYILISNFGNSAGTITMGANTGTGSISCDPPPPPACSVNGVPTLTIGACQGMGTTDVTDDIFTVSLDVDFADASSATVTLDGMAMTSTNTMTTTGGTVTYSINLPADGAAGNPGVVVIGDGTGTCTIDFTDFDSPASCSPVDCDADAGTITANTMVLCNLGNAGITQLVLNSNNDFNATPADPCGLAGTPGIIYGLYTALPTSDDSAADPNFISFVGDGPINDPANVTQAIDYGGLSFGSTPTNAATNYNTEFFICPIYSFDQNTDPNISGGTTAVDYDCGPPEDLCRDVNEAACVSFTVLEPIVFSNDMLVCNADPYTGELTVDVAGGTPALDGSMFTITNTGGNGTLGAPMAANGSTITLSDLADGPFEITATDGNGCSTTFAGVWNQPTIMLTACEDKVCTSLPSGDPCAQSSMILTDCITGVITPQLGTFTMTMPGDGFNGPDGSGFSITNSGGSVVFTANSVAQGATVTTTGLDPNDTYFLSFVDGFGDGFSCTDSGGTLTNGDGAGNNFGTVYTYTPGDWVGTFCGDRDNANFPNGDGTNFGPFPLGSPTPYVDPIGIITGPGITDNGDNTADFDPVAAGPGSHTINYDFTDAQGCVLNRTVTIDVCQPPANPIPDATCFPSCTADAVPMLTVTDGGGATAADAFEWYDSGAVDADGQPTGTLLGTGMSFDPSAQPGFDPMVEVCTSFFVFARGPESTGNPISGDVACYSCPAEVDFYRCVAGNPDWEAPLLPVCSGDQLPLHTLTTDPVDATSVWSIVSIDGTNAPVTAPFAGDPGPTAFTTTAGGGMVTITLASGANPGEMFLSGAGDGNWDSCVFVEIEHYKNSICGGCNANGDCDLTCGAGVTEFIQVCPLPDVAWEAGPICCTADPVFLGGADPGGLVSLTAIGGSYPVFQNGQWTGEGVSFVDPDGTPANGDEYYQFDPMGLDGDITVIYFGGAPCLNQAAMDFDVSCNPILADLDDITVCPGGIVSESTIFTELDDSNIQISTAGLAAAGGTDLTNVAVNAADGTAQIASFTATATEGTYTVMVTAAQSNANGCMQTVSFDIVVEDNNGLTFTNCPISDIMKGTDNGACSAVVTWDAPTAIDDCTSQSSITVTQTAGPASGSMLPVGTTTITYEANDGNGNTTTCSFDVIVMDTEDPSITCVNDVVTNTSADGNGNCTAVVSGLAPTASDNCGVSTTTYAITGATMATGSNDASGTTFNLGTSYVTYVATDAAGNNSSCTFAVLVTDDEAPSITCPANVTNLVCGDAIPTPTDLAGLSASDNCTALADLRLTVSDFDNGLSYCDNSRAIVRTYTVTDASGNQTTCTQTLSYVQDVTPPMVTVPAAALVLDCDDISATSSPAAQINDWLSSASATDACDENPIVTHDFVMSDLDVCAAADYMITVNFTATDDCGNSASASQTINVTVDTTAPTITAPAAALALDCDDISATSSPTVEILNWLYSATAEDACDSNPSITHSFDMSQLDVCAAADYMITVTFTATDLCGNSSTATQTIDVTVDDDDPMITAPAAPLALSCSDINETSTASGLIHQWLSQASATDGCDGSPTVTNSFDSGLLDVCAAADYMITVTFTATDACGNTSEATQTIDITVDDDDPMVTVPAAPLALDCSDISETSSPAAQIDAWLATATASDACDSDPVLTHSFDMSDLDVCAAADYMLTVTFTATDACGNTSTGTQTIDVTVDDDDPMVTVPAAPLALDCSDISNTASPAAQIDAWLATASASDACDSDPVLTHSFDMSDLDVCAAADYMLTVTFTATDACGNTSTGTQTIDITVDDDDPMVTVPAAPLALDCADISSTSSPAAQIDAWLATASGSDGCSGNVKVSNSFDMSELDVCAAADYMLTVTFTATDDCGNTSTGTQTIDITVDTTDPVLTVPAAPLALDCADISSTTSPAAQIDAWLATASVTDACDADPVLTHSFDMGDLDVCAASDYMITVTFTATDGCGNTSTGTQTIDITVDTTDPVLTVPAAPLALDCADISSTTSPAAQIDAWLATASVTDACDADPVLTHSFDMGDLDVCAASDYMITVTFTATDGCGNTSTGTQTIDVTVDATDPVLTVPAAPLALDCADISSTSSPAAQIDAWLATASATDACDADPVLTHSFDMGDLDICAAADYMITVTFTATDGCGNTSTGTQTIDVTVDDDDPMVTAPAAPLALDCANISGTSSPAAQIDAWMATASASDGCDSDPVLTHNFDMSELDICAAADYMITVTWTATDGCGNTSTASQTIDVTVDDEAPMITTMADDITVECNGASNSAELLDWLNNNGNAVATDDCTDVIWSNDYGTFAAGACSGTESVTVTFTATDNCGNTSTTQGTLTIDDTTVPTWEIDPVDITLECDGSTDPYAEIQQWLDAVGYGDAEDDCSVVVYSNNYTTLSDECGATGTATVTFTATDACGNAISRDATVTVIDNFGPEITSPAKDETVECDGAGNTAQLQAWLDANGGAMASDICGDFTWNTPVLMTTIDNCGNTSEAVYMFAATDDCGNVSANTIASFIIIDTTEPSFTTDPMDMTVECDGLGNTAALQTWLDSNGGAVATDICGGDVTGAGDDDSEGWSYDLVSTNDLCSNTAEYTYVFTATDACGNSETRQAVFTIEDTTSPLIVGGSDLTTECDQSNANNDDDLLAWISMNAGATATDDCSDMVTWTNDFDVANWVDGCNDTRFVDVTFTATDDCGNESSVTFRFGTEDTTPPVFTNCPRPDIVENAETDHCDAYVNFSFPEAIDNCGDPTITNLSPVNPATGMPFTTGDRFPVGTTILTFEAMDDCGNVTECTLKVIVNDYWEVPMITCPVDVTVGNDPFECGAIVNDLAPQVSDSCPDNLVVTYQIEDDNGDVIATGLTDASGFNFPVGTNTLTYSVQDQPLLLISEITQDGNNPNGGMAALPFPEADGDDYIEITNFGGADYDLSCLIIERVLPGGGTETFTVPANTILAPGEVLVLHYGPGTDDVTAPNYLFNLATGTDLAANDVANYLVYYGDNNIDAMMMFADAEGGIIRTEIFDTDTPADFVLAEACNPITLEMYNPSYPAPVDNGGMTSLQSIEAHVATCTTIIQVDDIQDPFCAEYELSDFDGSIGAISSGMCNQFTVIVPTSLTIGEVNILDLQITHADISELDVTLTSPEGTQVDLFSAICAGTSNMNTSLNLDATVAIDDAAACADVNSGGFLLASGLKDFYGEEAMGTWTLEIGDGLLGNDGSLDNWILQIADILPYSQMDTIINNEVGLCGATFEWVHPELADNCCSGTIEVSYSSDDDIIVQVGGIIEGGSDASEFFEVGTTTVKYTLTDDAGNMSMCSFDVTVLDVEDPVAICPADITINLAGGECRTPVFFLLDGTDNCSVSSLTSIPESGSDFEIGITEVTIFAEDPSGNINSCTFNVTVIEFVPDPTLIMACNDEINLSLDNNCSAELTADMILEGSNYGCFEDFCIEVIDAHGNVHASTFNVTDINQSFTVSIIDCLGGGSSCWGTVNIEEKLLPEIECPADITISCNQDPEDRSPITNQLLTGEMTLLTCEPGGNGWYEDVMTDNGNCNDPRASIVRTWYFEDSAGNRVSCEQNITIDAFDLADVVFPPDFDNNNPFDCKDVADFPLLTTPEGYPNDPIDGTGYPTLNGIPVQATGNLCGVSMNVSDEIYDICDGSYEILRTWKVRNMCGPVTPTNPLTHVQVIKVLDSTGPNLGHSLDDITVSTGPWSCDADVILPLPDKFDDYCGSATTFDANIFGGGLIDIDGSIAGGDLSVRALGLDNGDTYTIVYSVSDPCGNITEMPIQVSVVDQTPPTPVVKQDIIMSLTSSGSASDGTSKLYSASIDAGSYDNCTDVKVEIRRLDAPPSCGNIGGFDHNNNTTYNNDGHSNDSANDTDGGEYVKFCCEDLTETDSDGTPFGIVRVEVRVWDDADGDGIAGTPAPAGADNMNTTWVNVRVEDKAPTSISCPADITISCDQDHENLDITGVPNAFTTCGVFGVDDYTDNGDLVCGAGVIRRDWKVNGSTVCQQLITKTAGPVWDGENNISWPVDYDGSAFPDRDPLECPYETTDTGEPSFSNTHPCDQIAVSSTTQVFEQEDGACLKKLIDWTVIDWCQYAPNDTGWNGEGLYTHTQVIKIIDTNGPELTNCTDEMYEVDADCVAFPTLTNTAVDTSECGEGWLKWQVLVDTWGDGSIDWEYTSFVASTSNFNTDANGNGIPDRYLSPTQSGGAVSVSIIEALGANSNHKVTWLVTDGCGNVAECATEFMVADKKAPTPYCVSLSTAIMDQSGTVELWASDFNLGAFDNCTAQENLLFSFSGTAYEPNMTFTEADCGLNVIEVYVWDEVGNNDYCTVELTVDGFNCGNGERAVISGLIATENDETIDHVMVDLNEDSQFINRLDSTSLDGLYAFNDNPMYLDYEVTPSKDEDYMNGVSTLDLLLIQKHILGVDYLDSPYQVIAADINDSESVSALDLIELRKLILAVYDELPNNESWRFVDAKQSFDDIYVPWPFNESINLPSLDNDEMSENFIGVKIGDVNGSVAANANSISTEIRSAEALDFVIDDVSVVTGNSIRVDVSSNNFVEVFGYQFTLDLADLELNTIESGALNIDPSMYVVHSNGDMTFSYTNINGATFDPNDVLFTMIFDVISDNRLKNMIRLTDNITKSEAYKYESLEVIKVELSTRDSKGLAFELFQNEPNPFVDQTTIGFILPEAAHASFTLYDISGKVIKEIKSDYEAGYNTIVISKDELNISGVLYYELQSGSFIASKKMIVIE